MNKILILALATTAALVFSPATAKDHWGNKPEFSTLDDNCLLYTSPSPRD